MIRATDRLGIVSAAIVMIMGATEFASAHDSNFSQAAKAAAPLGVHVAGQPADDDVDDASALLVTSDFNRDGLADMARITLHADGTSDPRPFGCLVGPAEWCI